MNLSRRKINQCVELTVEGRVDAYGANRLSHEMTKIVHDGVSHLRLQLGGVEYISSAGIRVLSQFHKELSRIGGSLSIREPSTIVRNMIQLIGFNELLVASNLGTSSHESVDAGEGLLVERTALDPTSQLSCRLLGVPTAFPENGFKSGHAYAVVATDEHFGLGLGAVGANYNECGSGFGEWLMVPGAAAYLPSDRTSIPDYGLSAGNYRPVSQVLYGMVCEGAPAWRIRFEARGNPETVSLSEILAQAMAEVQGDTVGIMLAAETESLVGVALRKSPTTPLQKRPALAHPEILEWLTFTPEGAFAQSVTFAAGVVSRRPPKELVNWLRPLGRESALYAHLHAAVFSYNPLQRGDVQLTHIVRELFEQHSLQSVLHLVKDDRTIQGAGDSEFTRGFAWVTPIRQFYQEKDSA